MFAGCCRCAGAGKAANDTKQHMITDEAAAQKVLAAFEKTAKTHPYAAEIEGERELMALADGVAV